jgi:hypothetical protein
MYRKLAVALVAPLVLSAGACAKQSDETTVLTGANAVAALRAAPDAAAEAGSGRFEMAISFAGPDGSFDIVATGGYSGDQMTMEMDLGSAIAGLADASDESVPAGLDEPMQIVIDGTTAYLRIPMIQELTGSSGWLTATPEDLGAAGGSFGIGSGTSDPAQMLEALRGVAGDIEEKGPDTIRGVPTTRFGATIDLAKALAEAPPDQRKMLETQLKGIDASLARVPVDVWVDGDNLARRMVLDLGDVAAQAMGAGATATMTIDFFDYGEPVEVVVPDPSETTPFSEVFGGLGGFG